ncbi:MAG: ATP-binding protein [Verrucomicrobiota bacterium]
MNPPSIRRTLLIRCGLGVGVLLCLLSAGVYLLVRQSLYRELDESIAQTAALLANQVELENEAITYEWREGIGTNRALIEDGLFQFWDEKTGSTMRSPALHFRDLPRFSGIGGHPLLRSIRLPGGHHGRAIGLQIHPFVLPEEVVKMKERGHVIDPKSLPHILVVARDAEPVDHTLERLRWVLVCGSFLTLGLGFALIHRVVKVTLRPIDELAAQMKARAGHQLDSALDIPGELPTELSGLAENIDSLLARVAAIRQRERDFIRHAAHELRTPIAGLRATTDLALSQPRDAAAYAAHLTNCQKTAIELGELVKRLSALSRVGQPGSPAACEPVDIGGVLKDCLDPFLHQFAERGMRVNLDLPEERMIASGDRTLLRIIFNNLFDNAVSHAPANSELRIHARRLAGWVEIHIANRADGLPENPDRLFEPLFRKESSRSDSGSHLGIGLTLSREAAVAMGAALRADNQDAGWIDFVLSTPVVNPPD